MRDWGFITLTHFIFTLFHPFSPFCVFASVCKCPQTDVPFLLPCRKRISGSLKGPQNQAASKVGTLCIKHFGPDFTPDLVSHFDHCRVGCKMLPFWVGSVLHPLCIGLIDYIKCKAVENLVQCFKFYLQYDINVLVNPSSHHHLLINNLHTLVLINSSCV